MAQPVAIPFPTTNNPGRAPGEGSGRLVNCFAYQDAGAARQRALPGLSAFATLPPGEVRGALYSEGLLTVVAGSNVYQVDGTGAVTQLEQQVPGDGPVTVERNNAVVPQIVIVSSVGAFVIVNGVVRPYPAAPPPSAGGETYTSLPTVNSLAFLDGYFLFTTPAGKIYASDLNTTNVNALSFASAEARPDGLLRGIVYGSQFYAMGEDTIEVYADAATQPFPLSRTAVISQGLLGPWCVAGYQAGWAGPLIYVAQDNTVRMLDSFTPTRVSSEDLERLISQADPSALRANVYTSGGEAIFSLSSPDWTWELNVTTGFWHEREGYGGGRWRGALAVSAFGGWIVADVAGGALYTLDAEQRMDGPDPLVWGQDSGPVKDFPARIQCPGFALDFVLGADGNPNDPAPSVMLSWSHDGGANWAKPLTRSLQRQGVYAGRARLQRIGLTTHHGLRVRYRVSDPVYTSFSGGVMDAEARR